MLLSRGKKRASIETQQRGADVNRMSRLKLAPRVVSEFFDMKRK